MRPRRGWCKSAWNGWATPSIWPATARQGLARCAACRYAAVIVDQTMPGLSGLEVIRAIAAQASAAPHHHGHRHRQRTDRRRSDEAGRERLSDQGSRRRFRQRAPLGRAKGHPAAADAAGKTADGAGVGPDPKDEGHRTACRRHRPRNQYPHAIHRRQYPLPPGCLRTDRLVAGRLRPSLAGRSSGTT